MIESERISTHSTAQTSTRQAPNKDAAALLRAKDETNRRAAAAAAHTRHAHAARPRGSAHAAFRLIDLALRRMEEIQKGRTRLSVRPSASRPPARCPSSREGTHRRTRTRGRACVGLYRCRRAGVCLCVCACACAFVFVFVFVCPPIRIPPLRLHTVAVFCAGDLSCDQTGAQRRACLPRRACCVRDSVRFCAYVRIPICGTHMGTCEYSHTDLLRTDGSGRAVVAGA